MCFSPKVKVPQVDTNAVKAIEPAPLTESPSGVLFGGQEDNPKGSSSSEVGTGSSKSNAKVELKTPKAASSTSQGGVRKSITNKALNR
ncbi:hypothetical protein Q19_32 [Pectobacterium phage Q19]|uniref:Uncharacterized protein n=1 Tax=Pectobacterium phage Q19 TaxID=2500576 RepID=A0A678ZKF1_9CAUD|nr:hypothetical protein Q19_32 [Pectobacterium phage Q19]